MFSARAQWIRIGDRTQLAGGGQVFEHVLGAEEFQIASTLAASFEGGQVAPYQKYTLAPNRNARPA